MSQNPKQSPLSINITPTADHFHIEMLIQDVQQQQASDWMNQWIKLYELTQPVQYHRKKKLTNFFEQMNQDERIAVFEDTKQQVLSKAILTNSQTVKVRVEDFSTPIHHGYVTVVKTVNADTSRTGSCCCAT